MGTQIQNSLFWSLKGTVARVLVALLLVLLALPVLYHGILGMYALFWNGFTFEPTLVLLALVPVLVLLNAFGTLLSFRHALVLAGALVVSYPGWAFTAYPIPGLLPNSFIYWSWAIMYWSWAIMFVILCLNLAWIVWSLRRRLVSKAAA